MDQEHVDCECDSCTLEVEGEEIVFACEHLNTFDPSLADPKRAVWCVDCGAIRVSGEEWLIPGHNKYAEMARGLNDV